VICREAGWVATEVGRQPWAVWQVLRTADAASWSSAIWWSYIGVLVVYVGMAVGGFVVLRSMARRWRAGDEDLPTPYGPAVADPTPAEPEPVR
jgi:cytochrome d ubiquinol oxidase subunit I